jgi:hypothetical protein
MAKRFFTKGVAVVRYKSNKNWLWIHVLLFNTRQGYTMEKTVICLSKVQIRCWGSPHYHRAVRDTCQQCSAMTDGERPRRWRRPSGMSWRSRCSCDAGDGQTVFWSLVFQYVISWELFFFFLDWRGEDPPPGIILIDWPQRPNVWKI